MALRHALRGVLPRLRDALTSRAVASRPFGVSRDAREAETTTTTATTAGAAPPASPSSPTTSDDAPPPPRAISPPLAPGQKTRHKTYSVEDAVAKAKASATAKFDETIDVSVRLGVDPKRSDMIVRGVVNLPHGTGKKLKVCVFAEGAHADEARAAGADVVGAEDLIAKIKAGGSGVIDFDKAIAHPSMMPKLGVVARVLGPRGLMPNPKLGTLTTDIAGAVASMRLGRVEFRAEKNAIVHAGIGKASMEASQLAENLAALIAGGMERRPKGMKGAPSQSNYLKGAAVSATMGRGSFRIGKEALAEAAKRHDAGVAKPEE